METNFQHSRDLDFADRYTAQIEHVAIFCDTVTGLFTRLKAVQTPLVVKRNYGSRQARGYVRMLAIEARKLFAKPALYRTLATVASVALMKEIAAKSRSANGATHWMMMLRVPPCHAKAR